MVKLKFLSLQKVQHAHLLRATFLNLLNFTKFMEYTSKLQFEENRNQPNERKFNKDHCRSLRNNLENLACQDKSLAGQKGHCVFVVFNPTSHKKPS